MGPINKRSVHSLLVIAKGERRLELYVDDVLKMSCPVSLGFCPQGDKEVEGDGKTPEGEFLVLVKNPESKFHLSLGLSYPSIEDAERGLASGLIERPEFDAIESSHAACRLPPQKTRLGGEIYIHGGGTDGDWTRGCIAVGNDEMTQLFEAVEVGTRVMIRP